MPLPNSRESAIARGIRRRWHGIAIVVSGAVALVGGMGLLLTTPFLPLGAAYALIAVLGVGIGLIAYGWSRIEGAVRLQEVPLSPEVACLAARRIRRAEWLWVAGLFVMILGPFVTRIGWLALLGVGLFMYASTTYWAALRYERAQRLSALSRSTNSA